MINLDLFDNGSVDVNKQGDTSGLLSTNVHEEVQAGSSHEHTSSQFYAEIQTDAREQNFRASVSAWRKCANKIQVSMCDTKDISVLRKQCDGLNNVMDRVTKDCELLEQSYSPFGIFSEAFTKYDQIEQNNLQLVSEITECIRNLKQDELERSSKASSRSKRSLQSKVSSKASNVSKRIEAATEKAVLKSKLKFMDSEAQKRLELERVTTLKELDIAQAKLDVIDETDVCDGEFDKPDSIKVPVVTKCDIVQQFLNYQQNEPVVTMPLPVLPNTVCDSSKLSTPARNTTAPSFPSQLSTLQTWMNPHIVNTPNCTVSHSPVNQHQDTSHSTGLQVNQTESQTELGQLAKSFADQVSLGRLPTPEPVVFSGDPLKFPAWKSAFGTLIEQKGIAPGERIYYLQKYLSGPAREAVEGYFFLTNDTAYEEAKQLLEDRYGNPFTVANAFRDKLDAWPKVQSRDSLALRKFADFLRQCHAAMRTVTSLNILNDDRENQKLLLKLPEWPVLRWIRIVTEWKDKYSMFPPFVEFVTFIAKEAEIACDPMFQLHKGSKESGAEKRQGRYDKGKTFGVRTLSTESSECKDKSDNFNQHSMICLYCQKHHHVDDCRIFLQQPLCERKTFAIQNKLCFGCLNPDHTAKFCKHRKICQSCGKRHPAALHGDYSGTRKSDKERNSTTTQTISTTSSHTKITHMNDTGNVGKCSMIVPVWLCHTDSPDNERLVYALLDTQSDTTFILDETRKALGITGTEVKLLLSTMTAANRLVDSKRINGLVVRGYDSSLKLQLPAAYVREIMPANRAHIPTPEVARKWPHLRKIADKLMPVNDAEVGLLIGYNCPRALVPRDVIPPVCDEPYGQKSDLGWGIVGMVDPKFDESCDDPIGLSHRILTCEVPSDLCVNTTGHSEYPSTVLLSLRTVVKESINPAAVAKMMELDFSERDKDEPGYSSNDHLFVSKVTNGIKIKEFTEVAGSCSEIQLDESDPEVKKASVAATQAFSEPQTFQLDRFEYFSSWHRVKKAVAVCLRLKCRLQARKVKALKTQNLSRLVSSYVPVEMEELDKAEIEIIKLVQFDAFAEEIKVLRSLMETSGVDRPAEKSRKGILKKTSSIHRLDPFLDKYGILRVGGRLRQADFSDCFKHPAILPRHHHITTLIIRHCHEKIGHQGRGMTTNELRASGFWIVGCSSAVSQHISRCVECRRLRHYVQEQKMSDLPQDRTTEAPPFTYCGVDVFGPWVVKNGRKHVKRYGVLFTCLTCRAIHIETTDSLETDSFINALRRFLSIRGPIRQLRSDRGTNFVGAERELRCAIKELDQGRVRNFLLEKGCDFFDFKMNVPSSSHAGGVWERQIRTVRSVLSSLLRKESSQLDDDSLRTLMYEVTAIVNSRPLTTGSLNDPTSLEPLTPNHLLTMKSRLILPPPGEFQRADLYLRKRWRRVQHLANEFWHRWKTEYLQTLQTRSKGNRPQRNIKVGDVVLIKDDLPRNQWKLARVQEILVSADQHVRKAKLVVSTPNLDVKGKRTHPVTLLERPIQKLVLLLEESE